MEVALKRLTYMNAPAPCVLVSTLSKQGRKNVAAYGYWTPVDFMVPSVMFGARDFQHTYEYTKTTGEFVIGVPTADLAAKVWKTGNKDEECEDEFRECGLTPVPSETVKPFRIGECPINLECELMFTFTVGLHTWFVGRVKLADMDEKIYADSNWEMRNNLDALYHLSKEYFCKRGDLIVVEKD
jgi:flavin reductase (DIM6/NTAB) family NADH-FMN oxidoreductase RutF